MRLELGSSQALEKMQRFVFLYQNQLQHATRAVAVVDLRYNNGASVSWKG
jgi:cell division septal protein FtsQ